MRLWELGIKNTVAIFGIQLSKYQIDKLLIEEATLEDIFLHYYN